VAGRLQVKPANAILNALRSGRPRSAFSHLRPKYGWHRASRGAIGSDLSGSCSAAADVLGISGTALAGLGFWPAPGLSCPL